MNIVEIQNYINLELRKLGIVEIGNCGNRELWKVEHFGKRTKCYPIFYKFYLNGHFAERERSEYIWQLFIEMMVIHSCMAMASNSMDQHTYSRIDSRVGLHPV